MNFCNPRQILLALLLVMACSGLVFAGEGATISAQEGVAIQLRVEAGVDGFYRDNIPIPLHIEIFNGGENPFEGRIVIRTRRWIPAARYVLPVRIDAGRTAIHEIFIHEGATRNLNVALLNNQNKIVVETGVHISECPVYSDPLILVLSGNPDYFSFMEMGSIPGLRTFKSPGTTQFRSDYALTEFNLSRIRIARKVSPIFSRDLRAWESLSAVYIDLESYANLDEPFRLMLNSWLEHGGELMVFYDGGEISPGLLEKIRSSELDFLDWQSMKKYQAKEELSNSLIVGKPGTNFLGFGKVDDFTVGYVIPPSNKPAIYKSYYGKGGITFFCFDPNLLNPARYNDWIEIFFQLGLLTPTPDYYRFKRLFQETFRERSSVGSHLQTREEQNIRGIYIISTRTLLTYIVPLVLIALMAVLFYFSRARRLFLFAVLPLLVILSLLWPGLMSGMKLNARLFECANYMDCTSLNSPCLFSSSFLVEKAVPEKGVFKLSTENRNAFYDEIVSSNRGYIPEMEIYENSSDLAGIETSASDAVEKNDSQTYFLSSEETSQRYRTIIAENQGEENEIDGELAVQPDGTWMLRISNRTPYLLTNCSLYLFDEESHLPVMIKNDIPSGKTVNIPLASLMESDSAMDNASIERFLDGLDHGIISRNARRELVYSLEGLAIRLAFKPSHDPFLKPRTALFFAWTDELKSGLRTGESPASGSEITLVTGRVKVIPYGNTPRLRIVAIESLLPEKQTVKERSDFPQGN